MTRFPIALSLLVLVTACSSEDTSTPPAAPSAEGAARAPDARPPAAQKPEGQGGDPMELSRVAIEQATRACKNSCEDENACGAALMQALNATNAALQQPSDGSGMSRAAANAEVLRERFDGIARLNQVCLTRVENASKAK